MSEKVSRALRYSLVSVVSIVISQAVLAVSFGLGHIPARTANILACTVATGPAYYLNRTWAWGRRGKSNLWREIVPFWMLAFLGLAFSTWTAERANSLAERSQLSHSATTIVINLAALSAFGTLWIGKFALFNVLIFGERSKSSSQEQTAV
jgi:putative flippase GtrA